MFYLNSELVDFGSFPNDEIYLPLKKIDCKKDNEIKWIFESNDDFIKLGVLSQYMNDMNCKTSLYVSYLPYSRMDRPNGHYTISFNFIASFINSFDFKRVIIREPHSDVCMEKIKNSVCDMWCEDNYKNVVSRFDVNSIYYPDKGAMQRYNISSCGIDFATGSKKRDFKTGEILGTEVKGDVGKRVLIIDDLCSRGGTFINAAKLLKERGAVSVLLLVSYCEENVFTGDLFNYIDNIFVPSDSIISKHQRIVKIGE